MYAGGRIRRLISTVASPFHPFGGAVDIIVVQQQDGSYKSTPWYVRFGKFQGVLKRSEAIVTVTVNGVEANFNLYLDSSGEAYLLKEPDSDEEEDINSPRSSQSSEEAVLICNDSFKSLASQEYVDAQSDENGESELASPSVHGVSEVNQKKGNITITISEHNSMIADNRQRNDLPDGSLNHNLQNNDPESNLPMASEKTGDSILSMAENKDAPYGYPAGKVENRGGHLYSHMQSSFKENSIRNITTDNNENKKEGTERNNARKSHLETSLLLMEETINNYKVSRKSSEDDPLFLSEYNSYEYENMEFQQLDASDSTKTENENTEMVLMSVDGHMMTAPITSFKITDIVTLSDEATAEDIANNQDNYETCAEKETIADITIIQGNCETNVTANPDDCEKRAGAEEDINCGTSYACDSHVLDVNEGCNGHKQEQNLEDVTYGVENSQKVASEKISRDIQKELTLGMDLGKTKEDTLLRNESDLELVLNDDELYSGTDEEKYGGLYPCPEKEETEDAVAENKNINAEKDGVSSFQSYKSNPINVPGLHMIDKEVKAASGSLPNIMSHFPRTDIANSESLCSRSLDSCYSPGPRAKKIESVNPSSDALERRESVFNETTLGRMDTTTDTSKDLSQLNNLNYQGVTAQQSMDIEISLCRELLFKGMGSQAAAHAFASRRISREHFTNSASDILKNEKLVVKIKGRYFPWFAAASIVLGMVAFGLEVPDCNEAEILVDHVESKVEGTQASDSNSPSPGGWRLWPFSFRKPKAPETMASVSKSLTTATKTEEDLNSDSNMKNDHKKPQLHRVRTNIPSSEQLASLNLKEGQNMITFTFQTSVWGKQEVDARIYLWKWNTRVVISDVDGTITKSDVLGQVMPWVGKDWTQTGVARLFSAIKDNGYQLLFLSARALAQAYLTRQFLLNLKQDGKKLPDGPVVISPDGLFPSLYREVIRRAPHEFKISCLEDIRALFPPECNPFYAGFGNRDTDEISYLKVGIPKGKIFIINPKGQVVVNHCVDVKSYTSLHKLADDMFPPVSSCEQEDFNSWNYWKVPLPVIED